LVFPASPYLFIYLFIPFISVNIPSIVFGYTYSDVENYIAAHPAPSGCVYYLSPLVTVNGSGYRIRKRCNSSKERARKDRYINYTDTWEEHGSGYLDYYDCNATYKYFHWIADGTTVWGWSAQGPGISNIEVYCDGSTREYYDAIGVNTAPGLAAYCWVSTSDTSSRCLSYDTIYADFVPVEQCYNRLTGLHEPCAKNCADPAKKGSPVEVCGNGIDDNCNGQTDEGCAQTVLEYYSGNGQEGLICQTLPDPFEVRVLEGSSPKGGVEIGWDVTAAPVGSGGAGVSPGSNTTNTEGIARSYLTLGNHEGTYTVESTCPECDSGSPQTFTATARCPGVPVYYQDDYNDPYDGICKDGRKTVPCSDKHDEPWSIGAKGCALTSISMVLGRYGLSYFPPDELNRIMTIDINGYDPKGRVKWLTTDVITGREITYIDKTENYGEKSWGIKVSKSLMDKYLEKCMPVIVQVYNSTTGNMHWVVVTGKSGNDYSINDPSEGNDYKLLSQYGDIYNIRPYANQNGGCQ